MNEQNKYVCVDGDWIAVPISQLEPKDAVASPRRPAAAKLGEVFGRKVWRRQKRQKPKEDNISSTEPESESKRSVLDLPPVEPQKFIENSNGNDTNGNDKR